MLHVKDLGVNYLKSPPVLMKGKTFIFGYIQGNKVVVMTVKTTDNKEAQKAENTRRLTLLANAGNYKDPATMRLVTEAIDLNNTGVKKPLLELARLAKQDSDPPVLYGVYLHITRALQRLDAKEELRVLDELEQIRMQRDLADGLLRLGGEALAMMRPEAVSGALARRRLKESDRTSSMDEEIAAQNPENGTGQIALLTMVAELKRQHFPLPDMLNLRLEQAAKSMGPEKYVDAYARIVGNA